MLWSRKRRKDVTPEEVQKLRATVERLGSTLEATRTEVQTLRQQVFSARIKALKASAQAELTKRHCDRLYNLARLMLTSMQGMRSATAASRHGGSKQ